MKWKNALYWDTLLLQASRHHNLSPNDFRFTNNLYKPQLFSLGHRRQATFNALELLINDVVLTCNHVF